MDDRDAIDALVSDLHWQIDQLGPRGIKNNAGNPYNPSYYKRGLQNAIDRGGLAVADYVRRFLYKPPSDGYQKLEDAEALDLACEALVADTDKPYAHLFTDADRAAAQARLAPHQDAIARRKAASAARIEQRHAQLPDDIDELRSLAARASDHEESIAVNRAILNKAPTDVTAMNRLGRAYEGKRALDQAREMFERVLSIDPSNAIAQRRLHDLNRKGR